LPVAAIAQAVNGLYIGAGAGVNWLMNQDVKNIPLPTGVLPTNGKLKSGGDGLGPAFVLSMGWGFGNGLRTEIEGSYRYNNFNGAEGFGVTTSGGGKEQKAGAMVNVLYDFVGLSPWVQPYIGVGAGYQWVWEQNTRVSGIIPAAGFPGGRVGLTSEVGNSTKGAFAYQAIIGAAVPIVSVPGLALTAEYRFMGVTGNRNYSATTVAAGGGVARAASGTMTLGNNLNNSLLVGIRYNFGQAAPAPAPVAAPAPAVQPARSYLVFFDWDKATLTDRARQIIREAAENSTRVQYTRIEVNGYTDTSGTPQYNQRLSVRRAESVAAELVKNGVPRNAITIQGFGETRLLVPTGPNVREPQNRRVEIIIR